MRTLLVLTMLIGLLGMHGLAPASALPGSHSATYHAHHGQLPDDHPHLCDCAPGGGSNRGHHAHADTTCASGAIPGTVTLPDLALSLSSGTTTTQPLGPASTAPTGGRAPPSLAELHLLRI